MLDGSCTDETISVCGPALLHARHGSETFSKFAFLRGEYSNYDLGGLNITIVRDFSVFMAAASSVGQGDEAWYSFVRKKCGNILSELCKKN